MSRRKRREKATTDLLATFTDAMEGQDLEVCATAAVELAARIIAKCPADRANAELLRAQLEKRVAEEMDRAFGRLN